MGLWDFLESETTDELVARAVTEVKERFDRGWSEKIPLECIYDEEMRRLESLEDAIVTPPWYEKNGRYRDKFIQVLSSVIDECGKYFSDDIDNRLKEAQIFKEDITLDENDVLNDVATRGKAIVLSERNTDKVGTTKHPGALQKSTLVCWMIAEQRKKGPISLEFIEKKIQGEVKKAMDTFNPQRIWSRNEGMKLHPDYDKLAQQYNSLKTIMSSGSWENNKMALKSLAQELGLDEKENSSIGSILRIKDKDGTKTGGLDFMSERHPDILADVMLHKLLTEMNHTAFAMINNPSRDVPTLLNPKGYISLHAGEQLLSYITAELPFQEQNMLREFAEFRKGKIQKTVKKNAESTRQRIMTRLQNGETIESAYEVEMNLMKKICDSIIYPGADIEDDHEFRKVQMQILEEMIKEYKKCFVNNIDDRLQKGELFLRLMKKNNEFNNYNNDEDQVYNGELLLLSMRNRYDFLTLAKKYGLKEALDLFDYEKMRSEDQTGAFHFYNKVDKEIGTLEHKEFKNPDKQLITVDFFESVIQKYVNTEMKDFELQEVFRNKEQGKLNDYDRYFQEWLSIRKLVGSDADVKNEKNIIREVNRTLRLDEDLDSPFREIFEQKDLHGATGLDFMVEQHPKLLVDMMLYKMLTHFDKAALEIANTDNDFTKLNAENYMELCAQKDALSRIVGQFPKLNTELRKEYKEFREKAEESVQKESAKAKTRENVVADKLLDLYSVSNEAEPQGLSKIKALLNGYAKLSSCTDPQDRVFQVYTILKDKDYRVDLDGLGDFPYLLYSSAGGILESSLYKENSSKIHGIELIAKDYPELLDQFVAYALLRQLEKEVKVNSKNPNFKINKENYKALMNLKENIDIEECKKSISQLKVEYDEKLQKIADLTPEFYVHYNQWHELASDDRHRVTTNITKEDLRVLDTNDIEKMEKLIDKHDDPLLEEHLQYRISRIRHIEEVGKKGRNPEILKNIKLVTTGNDGNDNFVLEGIPHQLQTTSQGCWSVVLSEMLRCKGIELDQHDIRSYRAVPNYEFDEAQGFHQNVGDGSHMSSHMNLISKVLPNTALHRVVITAKEFEKDALTASVKEKIRNAVMVHKAPVGISYGGHYRLITGLQGNDAVIYDPREKSSSKKKLEDLAESWISNETKAVELFWLTDLDIKNNNTTFRIDRTKNPEYKDFIKYDRFGKLKCFKFGENRVRQEANDNVDYGADSEYVHENYGAFMASSNGKESEYIYLPSKLKLQIDPELVDNVTNTLLEKKKKGTLDLDKIIRILTRLKKDGKFSGNDVVNVLLKVVETDRALIEANDRVLMEAADRFFREADNRVLEKTDYRDPVESIIRAIPAMKKDGTLTRDEVACLLTGMSNMGFLSREKIGNMRTLSAAAQAKLKKQNNGLKKGYL